MTRALSRRGWMLVQAMWISVIALTLTHALTTRTVAQAGRVRQQLDREQTALFLDSLELLASAELAAGRDPAALSLEVPDWGRLTVRPAPSGWTLLAHPTTGHALERPLPPN